MCYEESEAGNEITGVGAQGGLFAEVTSELRPEEREFLGFL